MQDRPKELEPVPLPVYETWDSLRSVIEAAQQELPFMTPNQLATWFGVYHNTLLKLEKEKSQLS